MEKVKKEIMIETNDNHKKSAIDYLNEIIELSKAFSNAGQDVEFNAIQEIINKVIANESAPKPMTICGNCIHWQTRDKNRPDAIGLCIASKHGRSKMMFSGCGLHTAKNFSCKIHQLKQVLKTNMLTVLYNPLF